jgi:membrane fusion protein, heavy metal efflux system
MDVQESEIQLRSAAETTVSHRRLDRRVQALLLVVSVGIVVTAGLAVKSVGWAIGTAPADKAAEGTAAPQGDGRSFKITDRQAASLRIAEVTEKTFQSSAVTDGKIAIDDDLVTPVYSPYTGRVTRLLARAGDAVTIGDPLFAVQATELAQAQNDLISAASTLRTAKAQLTLSETNEKRQHLLYQSQGAALKDWQQSQVDLATAQGGFNTAQIALSAVRSRLRILGKSDADIETIEQSPDPLRLDADTLVRAPISGTVVQRQVGLGQNIISAATGASSPVFMIGNLSKVWLTANAREEDAPSLHKGDPVEVHVLAFPGRVFEARLTYVAASVDANTHRLPVRAEVDNPDELLKPEMFATFRIITGQNEASPAVPVSAIVHEGDDAHVWVENETDKTLEIRPIKQGFVYQGQVQVLAGLKAGEKVVTAGSVFIDRAVSSD